MVRISSTIRGLLLNEADREAGESNIEGRIVQWDAGYMLTILPEGSRKGGDIRKFKVHPEVEASVKSILSPVNWGTLVSLKVEDNMVRSVTVECDWAESI